MRLLRGHPAAEQIVPRAGFTAWLTGLTAFAMAALAVCALAATFAAGRLADRWSSELARSSTVQVLAPAEEVDRQVTAALAALRTTPGIVSARALDMAEQEALLAPWIGTGLPLDALPVPRLIVIEETVEGPDAAALALRLTAEAPGAQYDDHTRWRRPMIAAADRLRLISGAALALILFATAAMVTLASRAALAANARVITTLRLVGAEDRFIAGAFTRRFTLRALIGAGLGAAGAALAFLFVPDVGAEGAFVTGLAPQGQEWLALAGVPLIAAITAYIATARAAKRALNTIEEA
nr:FtsX-like permease family protein [Rubricella aquisinus]